MYEQQELLELHPQLKIKKCLKSDQGFCILQNPLVWLSFEFNFTSWDEFLAQF